jgi:hypothetical protein
MSDSASDSACATEPTSDLELDRKYEEDAAAAAKKETKAPANKGTWKTITD